MTSTHLDDLKSLRHELLKLGMAMEGVALTKLEGIITYIADESVASATTQNVRDSSRASSVGTSKYHLKSIQPWDIWEAYNLNPWDADIIKRVLRDKDGESGRKLDYKKIQHICDKRIEMLGG